MKLRIIFCCFLLLQCAVGLAQGLNQNWLLGNWPLPYDKGRLLFNTNSYTHVLEQRKMTFDGTQGNISDANGNLLMSSNGIWIANATGDTMLNGSGLNPGGITSNWPNGLPWVANNAFIPFPGNSQKYILLHHSAETNNGIYTPVNKLFRTVVDMNLDGGLGGVILKNDLILYDTINGGIGVCKHANGRDWWIVVQKDSSDVIFKILLDSTGSATVSSQQLNFSPIPYGNFAQLSFSRNGNKFIGSTYIPDPTATDGYLILADFDRCSGVFSNIQTKQLTTNIYILGLAFSPSGKYAYACSSGYIFQVDTDSMTVDTVAVYDGFISPGPSCCATQFWNMYLAANGKIYVTSGSSVQHITEINYPDSAGLACDVQQHAVALPGYYHLRAVPNHPNYYLGCDTTLGCPCLNFTGISEPGHHDFKFSIAPNPTNGSFKIVYLLPQASNAAGLVASAASVFEVMDMQGRIVYSLPLPPWSTLQQILLPAHLANGLYHCSITSGGERASLKLVVME